MEPKYFRVSVVNNNQKYNILFAVSDLYIDVTVLVMYGKYDGKFVLKKIKEILHREELSYLMNGQRVRIKTPKGVQV
jgi:hypothetical protein